MKLYTDEIQTAKLIELGFEKPKGSHSYWRGNELVINVNYSIGGLIEFIGIGLLKIRRDSDGCWWVAYKNIATNKDDNRINSIWSADYELIDVLYAMILQLKEERVI